MRLRDQGTNQGYVVFVRRFTYKEEAAAILLGGKEKKFGTLNIKLERLITIQRVCSLNVR